MKAFNKWLDTFLNEKGFDLEECFEVEGPSGTNYMSYGVVIEHIKIASAREQHDIKDVLVRLDFFHKDVKGYLRHLSKAIVI